MEKLTKEILEFIAERDWEKFHSPKNIALSLSLEASEVLELFQWTEETREREKLAGELSDVLYWLLLLAHKNTIDIEKAFHEKMSKNRMKYPVEKAKGIATKYTEL